jgi:nucleoside 2-deoxyribosyltransferase
MISDNSEFESHFLSQEPKSVQGKINLLMRYIAQKSGKPGDDVHIAFANDYPIAFCHDTTELRFYIRHLAQGGLLLANAKLPEGAMSLTVQGWEKMEQLQRPNIMSKQAFVAMSFDDSMNEAFDKGIKPLEEETGFSMFRADKMQFTNEKVCDKVIIEIRKSRFLIADVSGHRNAVYYEAGYAMGMGLPVIWTCRRAEREGCSFDSRQYNHIFWQEIDDLRTQLGERILAAIGKS